MACCSCSRCRRNACNPCDYFERMGVSVARWCPEGEPSSPFIAYASLVQTGALTAAAGAGIPFAGPNTLTTGFTLSGTRLLMTSTGTYRAQYIVTIPASATVDTTLALELGGQTVPGTQVRVQHTAGQATQTIVAQAIFNVTNADVLELTTTAALNLTGAAGDTLATLNVVQL